MNLYISVAAISTAAIGLLVAYVIALGPLVGSGVEESFGLAVALMFLLSAVLVHVVDRAYREWPEGRRLLPPSPTPLTNRDIARALRWVVLAGAGLLIAYVLAGVLS